MNPASLLPIGALACSLGATAALAGRLWVKPKTNSTPSNSATPSNISSAASKKTAAFANSIETWTPRLLYLAGGLTALSFLVLLWKFIAADVTLEQVFLYTKTTLPLKWRIAGAWAGREGSLLLWAAILAVMTALVARSHARSQARMNVDNSGAGDPSAPDFARVRAREEAALLRRAHLWTQLFLAAILSAFLAAVVAQDTFAATPGFFLDGRPEGNGINPTLKSPFILIHPPLMFVAYALATVPAAAVLGHLASGHDRWSSVAMTWARSDWLVYTFAMGLGGMWAYYTLGFGGYWAWDPVEVANLLPWLALTLYLHAQLHHERHGSYRVAGPFLGLLPLLLTLFSTISTRSGLWVSVHAFTDPTNTFDPDAPGRFLAILDVEQSLLFYVRLLLAVFLLGLALWSLRLAKESGALPRTSRVVAGILASYAVFCAIAPRAALSLVFEIAARIAAGHTGFGLLALSFAACLAAAAPALFGPTATDGHRLTRIDLRSLAYVSILALGVSLLMLFLFHMASANGWSTGFYEARLPFLASPALLGIIVLMAHGIYGRKRSVALATLALLVAVVAQALFPDERAGVFLIVLALFAVGVGFDKVRRAGSIPGTRRQAFAGGLLLAGALLDLVFWLNPPSTIGLGSVQWHPVWPAQFIFGGVALYALWGAQRILAGAPPRNPGHIYLVVALLAGFFLAPVMAGAAWLLSRPSPTRPLDVAARARLRQVALYGLHFTVCIALLGYAPSTYFKESRDADLGVGDSVAVGGVTLRLDEVTLKVEAGTPFVFDIAPAFTAARDGKDSGALSGSLYWEEQVGAHFPLPATLRLWDRDIYLNVESVRIAETTCGADNRTIDAYQAATPPRACTTDTVDRVAVQVISLPGLSLVWAALVLFAFYMAVLIAVSRSTTPSQTPPPPPPPPTSPPPPTQPTLPKPASEVGP